MRKVSVALVVSLALASAPSSVDAGTTEPQVTVHRDDELKETNYTVTAGDGNSISLTTYQTEINEQVIRLRSNSRVSIGEQAAILARILEVVNAREGLAGKTTLFVGRLISAWGPGNTQMSARLARAARNSQFWDESKGKPKSGNQNELVVRLANDAKIFPELSSAFRAHGLDVVFSSAEKVMVVSPGQLQKMGIEIERVDMNGRERLPVDCLAWFKLVPLK